MSENESRETMRQTQDYKNTKKILQKMIIHVQSGYVDEPEIFAENCSEIREKWRDSQKISEILRGLKSEVTYATDELKAMSKMLVYLGLVESLGVTLMDMVLIVLILNGKEVHTRGTPTRHIRRFKELGDLDLKYKLEFLEAEGFDTFKKFINKGVRDHIAHLKFAIQNNGEIRKKDIGQSPIRIDEEISKFWLGVDTIKLVLADIEYLKWFGIREE